MTNSEKALQLHEEWKGKLETTPKCKIATREDLALAYTLALQNHVRLLPRTRKLLTSILSSLTQWLLYPTEVQFSVLAT